MSAKNDKFREQLSAYLDGELSESEAAAVAEAVKADPRLARELDRLRAVKELLAGLPRQPAPAGLASRVLAQAKPESLPGGVQAPPAARAPWGLRLARLAAAAVVLIAVGLGVTMVCYLAGPPDPHRDEIAAVPDEAKLVVQPDAVMGLAAIDAEDMPVVQLNVGNRAQAEQELEEMFDRNDIRLARKAGDKVAPAGVAKTANFYNRTQTGLEQTQYRVVMTTDRLRRIVGELNALRASHDIAVIPMSQQLASARSSTELAGRRGRDRKDKHEGDVAQWHYAPPGVASKTRGPVAEPRPPSGKRTTGETAPKAVAPATTLPAKTPPPTRPAPTTPPLDYKQFLQDARSGRGRLASAEFQELVIVVNGAVEAAGDTPAGK